MFLYFKKEERNKNMAGYVIHLSVAEEYIRKHPKENEGYNEFIDGVIFPDSVKIKSETHYGPESSKANLYEFLKEHKLKTSFERGYFLHLLTDYLFYNRYIDRISTDLYDDYDILNDTLVEKYKVVLPEVAQKVVHSKKGKPKILSIELVDKLIKDISELDIDEVAEEVIKNPKKWTTMKF